MPSVDHSPGSSPVKTTPPQVRSRRPPNATKSQHLPRKREELSQRSPQSRVKSKQKALPGRDNGWRSSYWICKRLIASVLEFIVSVVGMAMNFLKPFFAVLVAVGVLIWVVGLVLQIPFLRLLTNLTNFTTQTYCSIPVVNLLPICGTHSSTPNGRPEFDRLITVQSAFEDVLESSSHSSVLPLDMKRSEASIRDLKQVVLYSNLPSKHELVLEFEGFVETARLASADLTRFNSRIGRAVDHIISTNKHTLQVLDGWAIEASSRSRFLPSWWSTNTVTEPLLLQQYLRHTSVIEDQIHALILEAQALLAILQNLDDRLDVIHGIVTRDGVHIQGDRDELFEQLWTKLGGNRGSVQRLDAQLRLLRDVSVYRRTAWAHVSSTTLKLQAIAAGLEDLRERVGATEVLGDDVPLRQHVETIQMGLERLERQRDESRRVSTEGLRRVLDRKMPGEERMIEGVRVHG